MCAHSILREGNTLVVPTKVAVPFFILNVVKETAGFIDVSLAFRSSVFFVCVCVGITLRVFVIYYSIAYVSFTYVVMYLSIHSFVYYLLIYLSIYLFPWSIYQYIDLFNKLTILFQISFMYVYIRDACIHLLYIIASTYLSTDFYGFTSLNHSL